MPLTTLKQVKPCCGAHTRCPIATNQIMIDVCNLDTPNSIYYVQPKDTHY